jgi:DNA-binding transcriptional regulator GbsR (MarR family)
VAHLTLKGKERQKGYMNLSISQIAKKAGVTVPAASLFIKNKKERGLITPVNIKGAREYFNSEDPILQNYFTKESKKTIDMQKRSTTRKNKKPFAPREDPMDSGSEEGEEYTESHGDSYANYEVRRMKAWAEKIELENQIKRNLYVKRDFLWQFLGQLVTVFTGVVLPMGAKLSSELAAIYACKDPKKITAAKKKLDRESYAAVDMFKRRIDDFLSAIDGKK